MLFHKALRTVNSCKDLVNDLNTEMWSLACFLLLGFLGGCGDLKQSFLLRCLCECMQILGGKKRMSKEG